MGIDVLSSFEATVLDKLLEGEHAVLALLRAQARSLIVRGREHTGVGFYVDFGPSGEGVGPQLLFPERLVISDVDGTMDGVPNGVGFVLFIESGAIVLLEGFSYGDPWPSASLATRCGIQIRASLR